jgi:hypothetical protein
MRDSRAMKTERRLQPRFIRAALAAALLLFAAVLAARALFGPRADRMPAAERVAPLALAPLQLGPAPAQFRAMQGWRLAAPDPRFGGMSSLVWDGDRLIGATDSGTFVELPVPPLGRAAVRLADLPPGPGSPRFKFNRDTEAIALGPGRRWWLALENRHALWVLDPSRRRTLYAARLPRERWGRNRGIEAMVWTGGRLLLLPEQRPEVLEFTGTRTLRSLPRLDGGGAPTDAAVLPDGTVLVALRAIGLSGVTNRLAVLGRSGAGYRLRPFATLPLGPLDNVEGLAVQPLAGGGVRLWLATDNDFLGWRRTLLVALDLPPGARP